MLKFRLRALPYTSVTLIFTEALPTGSHGPTSMVRSPWATWAVCFSEPATVTCKTPLPVARSFSRLDQLMDRGHAAPQAMDL